MIMFCHLVCSSAEKTPFKGNENWKEIKKKKILREINCKIKFNVSSWDKQFYIKTLLETVYYLNSCILKCVWCYLQPFVRRIVEDLLFYIFPCGNLGRSKEGMQAEKYKFLGSVPTMEENSRNLLETFKVLSYPAGTCARCAVCPSVF